jgi:ATP-dependent 26S proteasome regulatory subunit
VARSDLLKQLFAAYSRADDASFRETADRLIGDERRLGHRLLAADLEHALRRDSVASMTDAALTLHALPRGRDEQPLLAIAKPTHEMLDLVLSGDCQVTISEIVEENRNRSLLASFRLLPRRRLLFIGAPGTGKTAAAQAIASELSLPVATVSLSALMSSFLGETAKNVEAVLHFAELTPCVLIFDEFDAISTDRATANDHGEMRRVMATILQLIERIQGESLVVATSNHPQLMDTAIWRRFDEVLTFDVLSSVGIETLLEMRLRGVPHRVSLRSWSERLGKFTPAEVELIALDAQRRWVLSRKKTLDDEHLRAAVNRRVSFFAGRHAHEKPASGR